MSERLAKLQQMLEKQPGDAFLLYAIALEHKKAGQHAQALDYFSQVLMTDPGYCVAYHQAGLTHEQAGDLEKARESYQKGITAAAAKGDFHARDEMQAALDMIM